MKTRAIACILILFFPLFLSGQEIGLLRMNPDRPEVQGNAAIWGGIEEGRFRPVYAPNIQWTAGARAKEIHHGKNTSWMGSISFEQRTGYNVLSSMLLDPGYFPVDLLEYTQGTKSRQTGLLEAGFLSDLGYEWAVGIKASFKAAYAAKQTDLHHSAFGMDMQVEPVLTYVMDDDAGFATSYLFRLRTETIQVQQPDNTTDESKYFFLDKGMRYGAFQVWNGQGIFPIQEISHGFAERFHDEDFSAELAWVWKNGKAGDKEFGRYQFPGSTVSAFIEQIIQAEDADHLYHISYKRQRDQLRETGQVENAYTALTNRSARNLGLKYEIRFLEGFLKKLGIALNGNQWTESAAVLTWDHAQRYDGSVTFLTRFSHGAFHMDLNFLAGKGWWKDQGLAGNTENTASTPQRQTEDWLRMMEYCLVPRVGVGGTITTRIPSVKGLYLQLDASWLGTFNVNFLGGKNRETGKFTVGYNF